MFADVGIGTYVVIALLILVFLFLLLSLKWLSLWVQAYASKTPISSRHVASS
jgi:uncharacterized protein YqfA (UPF0365 family)